MKLRLAIIGCGAATERYYLPALAGVKNQIDEIYWVDTDQNNAQHMQNELGIGQVSDNYEKVLDKVDGAVIVVPHFLHYQITQDFLQNGAHVLCEKPLAITSNEVIKLDALSKKKNKGLCVNNTRRMFPNFIKVRELIKSGKLGQIQSIEYIEGANFAWPSATSFFVDPSITDKGILLDLGPHVLDTICWWLENDLEILSYTDDSFGGPESVAKIKARVKQIDISILLNRLVDLKNYFKITCEKGSIEGNIFDWDTVQIINNKGTSEPVKTTNSVSAYPEFVRPIFNNFLKVITNEEAPLVKAGDVISSINAIENSYKVRNQFELPWYKNLENIVNV